MSKQFYRKISMTAFLLISGSLALTACSQPAPPNANGKAAGGGEQAKGDPRIAVTPPAPPSPPANKPSKPALGQCELTKAPALNGFALGQTVAEIDRRISGFQQAYEQEKANEIESNKKANFVVMTSGSEGLDGTAVSGKEFQDVSFIWHFLDDKLIGLVRQDTSDASSSLNLKQFLSKTAKDTGLPETGWKIGKEDDADLTCQGFKALLTGGGQPGMSLMLFDDQGEQEKKKRGL